MHNSIDTAILVQEKINAQKEKITCIIGNITQGATDNPEKEILGMLVRIKSNHFKEGHTNGKLAVIVPVERYRSIIGDNAWMYNPPANINNYNTTAAIERSVVRAFKDKEWRRKLTAFKIFNEACAGANDLIIYRVVDM